MASDLTPPEITGAYTPPAGNPPTQPGDDIAGSRIGPYKLLQKLGAGGMGEVWLAEQREPVERRVALKLIKAGMDSAQVIARFEAERQALALMDHPNIARVLDAGTTQGEPGRVSAGRPYFVMELVKGISITRYCDQEHLTPRERLELFIPVCQAVQHAHQKGVIHRDLKPSNVLVSLYDGQPIPKIIDFGLAKAMHQRLSEQTVYTEIGQIVGTIEYMSPEQADPNNMDVDTRADVYSLGVILYELLTGSRPFPGDQLRKAAFTEMIRIIREVDPPRPSTRLSSSGDLTEIAAHRKVEPGRLTKLVHGELDWMVMKCLEKDRGRRYETAESLALDLKRYLANEPVSAGPPGAAYRTRKFLRRHWAPVTAAGLLVLALMAGAVGTTLGLLEARRQWAAAEEARGREAAQRQAAEDASAQARQNAAVARGVVDQFLVKLGDDRFSEIPGFEPARQDMVGLAVKRYRDLLRQQPDDEALFSDAAQTLRRAANLYRMTGRAVEAKAAYTESISAAGEAVRKQPGSVLYRRRLAETLCDQGTIVLRTEGPKAAEPLYREALRIARLLREEAGSDLNVLILAGRTEADLGDLLHERGRNAQALPLARSGAKSLGELADRPGINPVVHAVAASAWNNVAGIARESHDDRTAGAAVTEAVRHADAGLRTNPRESNLRYTRAAADVEAGRAGRAEALDAGITALDRLVADFPKTATFGRAFAEALTVRGRSRLTAGKPAEAEADARRALDTLEKLERQPGWGMNLNEQFAGALILAAKAELLEKHAAAAGPLCKEARRRLDAALALNPEGESLRAGAKELDEIERQIKPE